MSQKSNRKTRSRDFHRNRYVSPPNHDFPPKPRKNQNQNQIPKIRLMSNPPHPLDNTNPAIDTRAHWIALAKRFNVPIRCVYFTANTLLCQHNGLVRALNSSVSTTLFPNPQIPKSVLSRRIDRGSHQRKNP